MAKYGRDPAFQLIRDRGSVPLKGWAKEILDGMLSVAAEIDRHDDNESYSEAVRMMQKLVDNPDATPSARIIADLTEADTGFFQFALAMAESHRDYFASIAKSNTAARELYQNEADESLRRQTDIEESDVIDLDEYLSKY